VGVVEPCCACLNRISLYQFLLPTRLKAFCPRRSWTVPMHHREVESTAEYVARFETGADWREGNRGPRPRGGRRGGLVHGARGRTGGRGGGFYDQDETEYQSVTLRRAAGGRGLRRQRLAARRRRVRAHARRAVATERTGARGPPRLCDRLGRRVPPPGVRGAAGALSRRRHRPRLMALRRGARR